MATLVPLDDVDYYQIIVLSNSGGVCRSYTSRQPIFNMRHLSPRMTYTVKIRAISMHGQATNWGILSNVTRENVLERVLANDKDLYDIILAEYSLPSTGYDETLFLSDECYIMYV